MDSNPWPQEGQRRWIYRAMASAQHLISLRVNKFAQEQLAPIATSLTSLW